MRNTPKSESLLRAQSDRKESGTARGRRDDGVPNSDGDSEASESGSRSRSAAMRSAREDLSAHARGVESMNE
ncbi:hypothetical protein, partial [Rhodococcus sp. ARC_M6]|uniref:hypothetical protein n=1 Tax=Rhodococcus sp. ARC_M6 TaxID=2928852 RepID=UPI001FB2F5CE